VKHFEITSVELVAVSVVQPIGAGFIGWSVTLWTTAPTIVDESARGHMYTMAYGAFGAGLLIVLCSIAFGLVLRWQSGSRFLSALRDQIGR
jgi:hypothetical protein